MSNYQDETFVADADLSGSQYRIVISSGTASHVGLSGAGAVAIGVLQDKPTAGQFGTVRLAGKSRVKAGDTITAGALFTSDATGGAVAVASGNYCLGTALTGVASGGVFTGHINHAGYKG